MEALSAGAWREICRGTAVGHKKIDSFEPLTVSKLRFRAIQAAGEPIIRKFGAYNVGRT